MSTRFLLFLLLTLFLAGNSHAKTYLSDLEIDVPNTWSVKKYGEGLKFIIPAGDGVEFTPELLLRVRKGTIYIDDPSGAKFSAVIRKLSEASSSKSVYVRDPRVMILRNNTKALMYQADIERSDRKLVQTHLVFSSRNKHYILSYTDVPEAYESEKDKNYHLAWEMMNSIVIKSGNGPSREFQAFFFLKIIIVLLVIAIGVKYFRKSLAANVYVGGPHADILARLPEGVILVEVKAVALGHQREFTRPASIATQSPPIEPPSTKANLSKKTAVEAPAPRLDSVAHPSQIQKFNSQPSTESPNQIEHVSEDPDAKSLSEVSEVPDDEREVDQKVIFPRDEDQWDVEVIEGLAPENNQEEKRDLAGQQQEVGAQEVGENKRVI